MIVFGKHQEERLTKTVVNYPNNSLMSNKSIYPRCVSDISFAGSQQQGTRCNEPTRQAGSTIYKREDSLIPLESFSAKE